MSNRTLALTDSLYDYVLKNSLRESAAQKNLRVHTKKLPGSQMQIAPEQGQFFTLLIELIGARKTLDVGTFTGYSALSVAQALPADGRVIACDVDEKIAEVAKQFWQQAGVAHKIDLRIAPALQTLQQLIANGEQNTFDFAFIDADKTNYEAYYELCLQLVRRGGLIAVDNVLWSGRVADGADADKTTELFREFNARRHRDERVTLSLLPLADGISLLRKR